MDERTWFARLLPSIALGVTGGLLLGGSLYVFEDELARVRDGLLAAVLPSALFSLANHDRALAGVSALTQNSLLTKAAQLKADDMAAKGYFAHITPTGETPLYFLHKVGYRYQNVGENLGLNYADAQSVETAWLNSPKHKESLLLPQFTEIGIGVSNGTYQGAPATFVVALFATPLNLSATAQAATTTRTKDTARIQEIERLIASLKSEVDRLTAELKTFE